MERGEVSLVYIQVNIMRIKTVIQTRTHIVYILLQPSKQLSGPHDKEIS